MKHKEEKLDRSLYLVFSKSLITLLQTLSKSSAPHPRFGSPSIVCEALVPPKLLKNFWFPPLFFPTPNLKNWFPPFVSEISEKFLRAKYRNIYRNHSKNTLYYHLSMIFTISVQKGCNVCCRRQIFDEIHANLSLKVLIFVLFCT